MTYQNPTPNCVKIMELQSEAYDHFGINGFGGPDDPKRLTVIDWIKRRLGGLRITREDIESLEDNNAHCGAQAAEEILLGQRYGWWGWEEETDLDNDDDRKNVWFLTITDGGEEMAVIVHRTCPDENGVEKYPIDGEIANEKVQRAEQIVAALNHLCAPQEAS